MIKLGIDINYRQITQQVLDFHRQSVEVGVLQPNKKGWHPDRTKGLKPFNGRKAAYVDQENTDNRPKLADLAVWLDQKFGIFTDAEKRMKNRDLIKLMNEFAAYFEQDGKLTKVQIMEIERTARALVRNPILRGDIGKNKPATIKAKGFDWAGVDTGTLFKNIRGRYSER